MSSNTLRDAQIWSILPHIALAASGLSCFRHENTSRYSGLCTVTIKVLASVLILVYNATIHFAIHYLRLTVQYSLLHKLLDALRLCIVIFKHCYVFTMQYLFHTRPRSLSSPSSSPSVCFSEIGCPPVPDIVINKNQEYPFPTGTELLILMYCADPFFPLQSELSQTGFNKPESWPDYLPSYCESPGQRPPRISSVQELRILSACSIPLRRTACT